MATFIKQEDDMLEEKTNLSQLTQVYDPKKD